MKRKLLTLGVALIFTLSATLSAFAAANPAKIITRNWTNFRGNQSHNAAVSDKLPTSAENAALYWATKAGEGYGDGAIGSPILVDGYLYFNQGKKIKKMDAMSGKVVATGKMVERSNFSIIPPTYGDGKIFVGLANGRIQAFDAKTLKSLWVYQDKLKGQPNSPITYYKGYVYTGFWNSETRIANFACVSAKDGNTKKTTEKKSARWVYPNAGGYYWAGAYVSDNFVLVGTDDGDGGYTAQTSRLLSLSPKTGKKIDSIEGLNADIRSNVSYDKVTDRYYFTSKGGSFYSVKVSKSGKLSDLKELDLGGMSTSTPAIYNGRAYVGVSGKGQFDKYNGHRIAVIDLASFTIAYTASCMGYPQTSGLISTAYEKSEGYVYVYLFENMTPGKLRYLKDKPGQTEVADAVTETAAKASGRALELMLDFFACERGLRNIQKLRCLTRRALFFERVGNQLFFLLVHDLVEIKAFFAAHLAFEVNHAFIIYVDIQKLIHRVLTDLPLALADIKTMHCIFQLSDIAGPVIFLQLLISLRREGFLNAVL